MKPRILAYGIYMALSIMVSLTISFIPPLIIFFALFQNLDSTLTAIGWPFENIRLFAESLSSGVLPTFFFEYFWFLILLFPIFLVCYGIFLGFLFGMFRLSRWGIPYLEDGKYSPETEKWLLYEFYEVYYYIFRRFQWFFSVFLESKIIHQLFGAKIGRGTILGNAVLPTPDRTIIGDNCIIGHGGIISGHVYEDRTLYLKPVKLGNNVTVGGYAIIFAGAEIGDNVIIGANTVVPKDRVIPPNTIWVHGKAIRRKTLEWDEEEYKALAEEFNNDEEPS